jgi:hypothetical protein
MLSEFLRALRTTLLLHADSGVGGDLLRRFWLWTLLGLILRFVSDLASVGTDGHLALEGVPDQLFAIPVMLFTCWALARLARRSDATLALAAQANAARVLIELVQSLYYVGADRGWLPPRTDHGDQLAIVLPLAWLTLATAVAACRMLRPRLTRRVLSFVMAAVLIYMPMTRLHSDLSLWVPNDAAVQPTTAQASPADEEAFYSQPALLDDALDAVQPGARDRGNLFFVGVAGDAEQDVFMKEVLSVGRDFDQRFGAAGHSILLINNAQTLADRPIATNTALAAALDRVGEVMNKDRDILFLFLTSHGSPDHHFAVAFDPMRLDDLTPDGLRAMLDHARIKHRVVVVSACYSGGFVDTLKGDDTLVITASAADRTSFGCSDDVDYTYFGEAYFAQALKQTDSFIDAFALAKRTVTARETKEGFAPSEPQMSVGKNIASTLAQWQSQRAKAPAAADRKGGSAPLTISLGRTNTPGRCITCRARNRHVRILPNKTVD